MLKTSRHIVEATEMGLQRMTTYVSSSSKRMQIGDFIFPEDEVLPRVKNQQSYKNIIKRFNELSEAIKDALNQTIEEQKQKLKSELQKKEVNKKGGVNKLEEGKLEAKENQHVEAEKREGRVTQEIQQEENERNQQNETKELKKDSDAEKNKDGRLLKGKPEGIEEEQGDGNESGITQADKTGELPEITVKEKLEEETRRRTESSNQELQEALKETNRLLHERTEQLQNVKGVLENLLKEKEGKQKLGNGIVGGYGKIQADNTQKLTEEGGDVETKNRQLQEKGKQNLSEKTQDLRNSEASEKQWFKNDKADEKETTEESRKNQTRSLEKSRSHQTKTWLIEHTLNEDESRILREKMTQLYDATCKDLEADIFKLLDQLQYNEIKKHEIFRGSVASKMKIINQLLGEANESVDAEYKELISLLEAERARLQKILNSPSPHEDPYFQSTFKKIEEVIKNTKELEDDVNKFQGNRKDPKFLDLEHKLLNNVMKLDVIQAKGRNTIRTKKTQTIEYVTNCMEKLDANVIEGA